MHRFKRIHKKRRTMSRRIHIHDRECGKNLLRCQMLEWWARGNVPTLQKVVDTMKEVINFISTRQNEDLQSLNIVGVPWKRENSMNLPPRIRVTRSGVPKWEYLEGADSAADDTRPVLAVISSEGSRGIADEEFMDCPSAMAAFVKGSLGVGKKLYNECLRVVKQKRRIDVEWRTKTAKVVVDEEVFGENGLTRRAKRKIDEEWQEKMDHWKEAKRVCRRHYEGWRVMECMKCDGGEDRLDVIQRGMQHADDGEDDSSSGESDEGGDVDGNDDDYSENASLLGNDGNGDDVGDVDDDDDHNENTSSNGGDDGDDNIGAVARPPRGTIVEVADIVRHDGVPRGRRNIIEVAAREAAITTNDDGFNACVDDDDDGASTTANPPSGDERDVDADHDVAIVKTEPPRDDDDCGNEDDEAVDDVDVKVFSGGEECDCGCCDQSSSHGYGDDDGDDSDVIWD